MEYTFSTIPQKEKVRNQQNDKSMTNILLQSTWSIKLSAFAIVFQGAQ